MTKVMSIGVSLNWKACLLLKGSRTIIGSERFPGNVIPKQNLILFRKKIVGGASRAGIEAGPRRNLAVFGAGYRETQAPDGSSSRHKHCPDRHDYAAG